MTMARLVKILNRTKRNRYPKKFIARRGTADFIEEWAKLKKAPKDNKAKMFQALLKKMIVMNKLYANKKTRNLRPKIVPVDNFEGLLLQLDDWKKGHVDIGNKHPIKGKNIMKKLKKDIRAMDNWERDDKGNLVPPDDFDDDLEDDDDDYVPTNTKDIEDDDFDEIQD